jgi:methylase of polypeptide subunit release factors/DNA modification methylase
MESNKNLINKDDYFDEVSNKYLKSINNKKKEGIVYTPKWIASHIVNHVTDQWIKIHRGGDIPKNIADVCCGTGVFLKEILDKFEKKNWKTNIYGYDKDSKAIEFAKLYSSETNSNFKLFAIDTLAIGKDLFVDKIYNKKFDIIIGNPPYVKSQIIDRNYVSFLKKSYRTISKGPFDLSIVFLEKISELLNDGGIASIILTNKFMNSAYGKEICNYLSKNFRILTIEDFQDIQLFKGYTTYTCIVTFAKLDHSKRFLVKKYKNKKNFEKKNLSKPKSESFAYNILSSHPWNFVSGNEEKIIRICSSKKNPYLLSIFNNIFQGIRTGANDVFVVDKKNFNNIDSNLKKPFILPSNIKKFKIDKFDKFLLYPYEKNNNKINPIEENKLKKYHKKLYTYLFKHHSNLKNRSLQSNCKWYEYSRGQNLESLGHKKIIIKEMMPVAEFSADIKGKYAFASGYALDADGLDEKIIISWSSILSSPVMEFILRHHGTQLHSGWFRLMKQHLKQVQLPNFTNTELKKIFDIINQKKNSKDKSLHIINNLVAKKFGLSDRHINYINEYLLKIHLISNPKNKNSIDLEKYQPVKLEKYNQYHSLRDDLMQKVTFSLNKKLPIHNWYKYTQGFSADLVSLLLNELSVKKKDIVLDPFNGCGTTTTVCAYKGIKSIGLEISPLMSIISKIKSRKWNQNKLKKFNNNLNEKKIDLKKFSNKKFIFDNYIFKAYSLKIRKSLIKISNFINSIKEKELKDFCSISLLSILEDVSLIRKHGSHYRFLNNSNSIGLQKLNINVISDDKNIYNIFFHKLENVLADISLTGGNPEMPAKIDNINVLDNQIKSSSIDYVITSPPYLNRNNYISQQKAELDFLNLITSQKDYKKLVKSTFKSHTDAKLPLEASSKISDVQTIINSLQIEDGNNSKIPNMISGYFDDLTKTLKELYRVMKINGTCVFVVGNTRWGGIVVPVDHLLAKIAEQIGFKIQKILITRFKGNSPQQMKKFGKIPVRESIVIFKK